MRKNKLRLKVTLEEIDVHSKSIGHNMSMKVDIVNDDLRDRKTKSDIAFMLAHWFSSAEDYFEFNKNEEFKGEAADPQEVIENLRKLSIKIQTGEYKISELISLTNIDPESTTRGNGTVILNIRKSNG
jgi:hypothetical protein